MGIITQKNIEDCKDFISFSFDKEKINEVTNKIAKDIGKKYKIKGFRKGKAPEHAVKIVAKDYILEEAKKVLINEAYKDILFETKLKPFGNPELLKVNLSFSDFSLDLNLGYMPNVELKEYKGFELALPDDLPSQESVVEQIILNLCKENFEPKPFDENEFVEDGDNIVVNYKSFVEGQSFENSEALGVVIDVGNQQIFRDFEVNVMGMQIGDVRNFDISFPLEMSNKNVAGKTVSFEVELVSGMKKQFAEYNESLAKKLGLDSFEALHKKILEHSVEQFKSLTRNEYKKQIVDLLLEKNDVIIPKWIENQALEQSYGSRQNSLADEEKQLVLEESIKQLKLFFIFDKIKELEVDTVLTEKEVENIIFQNLSKMPSDVQHNLLKNNDYNTFVKLQTEIQNEQIFEWIIKNSKIKTEAEAEVKTESNG